MLTLHAGIRRPSVPSSFARRGACWLVVLTDLSAAASIAMSFRLSGFAPGQANTRIDKGASEK